MSTTDGGPAFPFAYPGMGYQLGMSLRDHFAIHFAAASVSRECVGDYLSDEARASMAAESYRRADAMLAERSK